MILTCLGAALLLFLAELVGSAVVVVIAPARGDRGFLAAASPLLGIAVLLAVLDVVELWLPLRTGAWVVPALALLAAAYLLYRRALPRPSIGEVAVVVLGIAVGALPTAIVGRATAVALTNDDATYYLAVAERLVSHPWLEHVDDGGATHCLTESVVHGWLWRTGAANLAGVVVALARVDGTVAIAVVTATLTGLVAQAATAIGVAVGVPRRPWWPRAVAAAAVVLSAAPIFLGWQHLLGQLFAFALFPVALAALARVSLRGGVRRVVPAALLIGGAMNVFADAAPMMFLGVVALLVLGGARGVARRVAWTASAGVLAAAAFPMTFWRAAWAAFGTVAVRTPAESAGLFPQRGWLDRLPVDDLATLLGVDPWPPWPAPWPPTATSVVEYAAVAAALAILAAVIFRERRRPGLLGAVGCLVVVVGVVMIFVSNRYVRAKCLLLEASLVIPMAALTPFVGRRRRWIVLSFGVWVVGDLVAAAQLARPSGFHVVDEPDHDRLSGALARLPPGSLLVLDGFGAPADVVHDEHRAMRAAHRNGIVPIQPGLDGGFFKPVCQDPALGAVPDVGWALQRAGAETISGGEIVERFGRFTLRKIDLTDDDGVVGAWAPTHGWMRAETDADGTVFRWGERVAAGTLRVVTRASCGRLTGDVRSVDAVGSYSLTVGGALTTSGNLTPIWAPFRTGTFLATDAVQVELHAFVTARDEAHAIALRRLAFTPARSCLSTVARHGEAARDDLFPDAMHAMTTYDVGPATGVRCGVVTVTLDAPGPGGVIVATGNDRTFTAVGSRRVEASSLPVDFRRTTALSVLRAAGSDTDEEWRVLGMRVRPEPCHDDVR
ncbi:MAG TPA: hypothetical protein VGL81_29350 [Polyangiaceae bacterium]|jgi:hypothetical protein